MVECRCLLIDRLDGDDATSYALDHLLLVERGRNSDGSEDYVCIATKSAWVMEFPLRHWAEDHRGRPTLTRLPLEPGHRR